MSDLVRFRYSLTPFDMKIIERLIDRHQLTGFAGAFRFVAEEQKERDRGYRSNVLPAHVVEQIRREAGNLQKKSRLVTRQVAAIKHGATWLDPIEVGWLDQVARKYQFRRRAEAVRFCLRVQARIDDITPN